MKIAILNGPNLNLLGIREPELYGSQSFEDYFKELEVRYPDHQLIYYQSNSEGKLIDKLHEIGFEYAGIVLNAGGLTHTSVALSDAIAGISAPVIEVHISNIFAREKFRHRSYISMNAAGVICGLGMNGYDLAISHLVRR